MTTQHLDGVHQLRAPEDLPALREPLGGGGRVVVVGDGQLASEAVASAQATGCNVTLLVPGTTPLRAAPGANTPTAATLHRRNGVQVLSDAQVAGIHRSGGSLTVTLTDGWQCAADLVVLAPATEPRLVPTPELTSLQGEPA